VALIIPSKILSIKTIFEDILTYILVQSCVFLAYRFKPDNFSSRESHDKVDVIGCFSDLVDIMAKTMSLGEQNLGEMFRLDGKLAPAWI
jgi:hypothetical protein